AGFFLPGQYCPDERRFLPYDEREPEVLRYLRLMEFLGVPSQGEELEFPLLAEDAQALAATVGGCERSEPREPPLRPGEYVCVHPGAKASVRRWPPERFAAVADALAARGFRVVLTGS